MGSAFFVLFVRDVLVLVVVVEVLQSLLDFVVFRIGFSALVVVSVFFPRRRVWRDNIVESEHVVVDRMACLTDSLSEFIGKTVTAIAQCFEMYSKTVLINRAELKLKLKLKQLARLFESVISPLYNAVDWQRVDSERVPRCRSNNKD